jgi:hypothetical protein
LNKWDPKEQYYREFLYDLKEEMPEPPCKWCKYWKPHRQYNSYSYYIGVRCCISPNGQRFDFSCFCKEDKE